MKCTCDPILMSLEDRLQELSTILAQGYLRHLTKRRISPAGSFQTPESPAPWPRVESIPPGKEYLA